MILLSCLNSIIISSLPMSLYPVCIKTNWLGLGCCISILISSASYQRFNHNRLMESPLSVSLQEWNKQINGQAKPMHPHVPQPQSQTVAYFANITSISCIHTLKAQAIKPECQISKINCMN